MTVQVDGRVVGELWLLSRWAGSRDVPVIVVTGDGAAIDEAGADLAETPGSGDPRELIELIDRVGFAPVR
jgi:D-aminopeptidase